MDRKVRNSSRGFTLLEMLIAFFLGVIIIGAAVSTFRNGSNVATITSQRSLLQTDLRAAEDMMVKDISMAGAGMPSGGIPVPNVAPLPKYGCDLTGVCYVVANFPSFATVPVTPNTAYYILPGPGKGPAFNGQPATDTITVIYADTAFLLNDYTVTFNATGTNATFAPQVPVPAPAPQAVNDPVVGLKVGDVVVFQNTKGAALAVITAAPTQAGVNVTAPFANGDVLKLNNSAAASQSIPSILAGTNTQASRIWIITYYLDTITDAGGNTTARLMRQVNTQPPVPLADNIINLKFTYDAYDSTGILQAELPDAGAGNAPPVTPNMIQKVNLAALTGRSPLKGPQGYQGLSLQTQISVRNLSFKDRYQ